MELHSLNFLYLVVSQKYRIFEIYCSSFKVESFHDVKHQGRLFGTLLCIEMSNFVCKNIEIFDN